MHRQKLAKLVSILCISLCVSTVLPCRANADVVSTREYNELYTEVSTHSTPFMQNLLKGITVTVIDNKINSIDEFKSKDDCVTGLWCPRDNRLFVSTTKKYDGDAEHRFYHELGHALDTFIKEDEKKNDERTKTYYVAGIVGRYSNYAEFKSVSDKYYSRLNIYSYELFFGKDIHERFAETYAIYIENPQLRDSMPDLFEFFDRITDKVQLTSRH